MPQAQEKSLAKLVYRIFTDAIKRRASDIFIEPMEEELRVRLRIDGLLASYDSFPANLGPRIVSRLKVISNLDIAEHRLPQDGRFKLKLPGKDVDFRLSTMPSRLGEKAVLRVLDKSGLILDLDKLGITGSAVNLLKENLKKPYGMILVCGPTGCGKTTTLYSSLKFIDRIEKNIITAEDPIEYQLYGINQVSVQEDIGLTFAAILRSILRQDPNIILVGEIRDTETAEIAVQSALTGHLVLSTLHTTTSTGAVTRLINMGVEPYLISASCLLICSQVLVRALCPQCKEEYRLAEYKEPVFKPKGCEACNQTGYQGRTAVMEAFSLTETIKDLISQRGAEMEFRKKARAEGMSTLRENAMELALKGITSLEEVTRVTPLE
jgi:type II secretory ATPase GspE/PulE/Tfp pilus assembly ATPase PilB-like protein